MASTGLNKARARGLLILLWGLVFLGFTSPAWGDYFVLGNQTAGTSAVVDTVYPSVNGTTDQWITHPLGGGTNAWKFVDESGTCTYDSSVAVAVTNRLEMFGIPVDTTELMDSVRILLTMELALTAAAGDTILFEFDSTNGAGATRINKFSPTTASGDYISSPIIPTRVQMATAQIGVRNYISVANIDTVACIKLQRFYHKQFKTGSLLIAGGLFKMPSGTVGALAESLTANINESPINTGYNLRLGLYIWRDGNNSSLVDTTALERDTITAVGSTWRSKQVIGFKDLYADTVYFIAILTSGNSIGLNYLSPSVGDTVVTKSGTTLWADPLTGTTLTNDVLASIYLTYTAPVTIFQGGSSVGYCYWGDATVGGTTLTIKNQIGCGVFVATRTIDVDTIGVYLQWAGTPTTEHIKCAIYQEAVNPTPLLTNGTTIERTFTAAQTTRWFYFSFSTNPSVTAGNRYAVCAWGDANVTTVSIRLRTVTSDTLQSRALTYTSPFPDPLGSTVTNNQECAFKVIYKCGPRRKKEEEQAIMVPGGQ